MKPAIHQFSINVGVFMPYNSQFLRVSFLFSILGTDEVADTSINYGTAPGWTGAAAALDSITTADMEDMIDAWNGLWGGATEFQWADYSKLEGVKIAAIGTDGHYVSDAPKMTAPPFLSKGGNLGVLPQDTICVSTQAVSTLGSGNRGRMYLPHTKLLTDTGSPMINGAVTDLFVIRCVTFMNAVTTAVDRGPAATLFPVIMSKLGAGTCYPVNKLRVGNVNDTQRRRRNRLQETYSEATL